MIASRGGEIARRVEAPGAARAVGAAPGFTQTSLFA
ncbi:MGMT family protein [Candidatus Solirubrobacter pratensis]|nr:MGMT family protein [Candidatus Solirubrobacter pratensis]